MSKVTKVTLHEPFNLQSILKLLSESHFSVEITDLEGIRRKGKIITKDDEEGYFIYEQVDSPDYPFTTHLVKDDMRGMEILIE